jgi:hypothetical protein
VNIDPEMKFSIEYQFNVEELWRSATGIMEIVVVFSAEGVGFSAGF